MANRTYEERLDWFTQNYGKAFKEDRNGTLYFADYTCNRCGGAGGHDAWKYTGWTCYECGGTGRSAKAEVIKLYTPEYEVKLEERRQKASEKRQAKLEAEADSKRQEWLSDNQFTSDGFTFMFLGNTFEMKDAIKETGAKFNTHLGWHIDHEVEGFHFLKCHIDDVADKTYWGYAIYKDMKSARQDAWNKLNNEPESQWLGQVGDKIEVHAKYMFTHSWETNFGYGYWTQTVQHIHIFKDSEGHTFKWKTSNFIDADYGTEVVLKGTVKDLDEYKGEKQTVLTRCKVQGVA